jgi:opacity protein-like surface antigen
VKVRDLRKIILRAAALFLLAATALALPAHAQKQEVGFTIGGLFNPDRSFHNPQGTVQSSSGISLGADYAHRFWSGRNVALYGEIEFVANARDRQASSANAGVPRTYATLYLAPGVRLKFRPASRFSPWAAFGGGYAQYEQAQTLTDGRSFSDRRVHRGVFDFGIGTDYRVWRFVSVRGEIRDYVSGNPALNVQLDGSLQHNVIPKGGIVFGF